MEGRVELITSWLADAWEDVAVPYLIILAIALALLMVWK